MALRYNIDGTVSNIVINAIINGKVTSSVETAPNIQQSLQASASNAIIDALKPSVSSSHIAYGLGYPTNTNPTNTGYTYLSSATQDRILGIFVQYPFPSGSAVSGSPLYDNGVLVSSSAQANQVLYGDGLNHFGNNYGVTSYKFEIASQSTTFASASLADLLSQQQYSQSISLGRIVKISIPTSVIEPAVEQIKTSADAQKLVVSGSNGVVESLTLFNYITGSTVVVFASASKNDMGSIVNNNLTFVVGVQRVNATTLNRDLGTYTENGILVSGSNQAFEAKYPTNKSDWTSINGVLTSPKNQ
jgi:hypothetical protein